MVCPGGSRPLRMPHALSSRTGHRLERGQWPAARPGDVARVSPHFLSLCCSRGRKLEFGRGRDPDPHLVSWQRGALTGLAFVTALPLPLGKTSHRIIRMRSPDDRDR